MLNAPNLSALSEATQKLTREVSRVREDVLFRQKGGTVYYAVDFAEVHAFLYPDQDDSHNLGMAKLAPQKRSVLRREHLIALAYLFQARDSKIFLLPPHVRELSAFMHWVLSQQRRGREMHRRAKEAVSALQPSIKTLLRKLDKNVELTTSEIDELVEFVQGKFQQLCVDIGDYESHRRFASSTQRLQDLLESGRLCTDATALLPPTASTRPRYLPLVSAREQEDIFRMFPPTRNRFNRKRDADALLFLRDLNLILSSEMISLIFITRDKALRNLLPELAATTWYRWPMVERFVRTLDSIIVELMLASANGDEERLEFLDQLNSQLEGVNALCETLRHSSCDDDRSQDYETLDSASAKILKKAINDWTSFVNLKLSLAVPDLEWYEGDKEELVAFREKSWKGPKEIKPLLSLWRFVRTPQYKDQAEQRVLKIWHRMLRNTIHGLFIGALSSTSEEDLTRLFEDQEYANSVLRSTELATPIAIRFFTSKYRTLVARFAAEPGNAQQMEDLKTAFLDTVGKVANEKVGSEDYLFMAFELAILDRWAEAEHLAQAALNLASGVLEQEIRYFLGVSHKNLARKSGDAGRSTEHLKFAFDYLRQPALFPEDDLWSAARNQKEIATVVLWYHALSKRQNRKISKESKPLSQAKGPSDVSEREAVEMLGNCVEKAGKDLRLRVEILNNLTFSLVVGRVDYPDPVDAVASKLRLSFEELESSERGDIPQTLRTAVCHTLTKVKEKQGIDSGNRKMLEEAEREYEEIIQKVRLSGSAASVSEIESDLQRLRSVLKSGGD